MTANCEFSCFYHVSYIIIDSHRDWLQVAAAARLILSSTANRIWTGSVPWEVFLRKNFFWPLFLTNILNRYEFFLYFFSETNVLLLCFAFVVHKVRGHILCPYYGYIWGKASWEHPWLMSDTCLTSLFQNRF